MSARLAGWRVALRVARRDALRHRGRSALVLVMIALPVLAVTAADVLIKTQSVSGVESLDRRLGHAEARIFVQRGIDHIEQGPDPDHQIGPSSGADPKAIPDAAQVRELLGGAQLVEVRQGQTSVDVPHGQASLETLETDLGDPITHGLVRLTAGRLPAAAHEVVINRALADKGYVIGDRLRLSDSPVSEPTIVGIAESTTVRTYPEAAGPLGSLGAVVTDSHTWLVGGGPVSWHTVRALNAIGATVLSRSVVTDPPPRDQIPASVYVGGGDNSATLAVVGLIVVMALIEVVLLAGPAFAVTARRQQHSLALMSATGGTPKQARRVVLASAVVLGAVAAAAGVLIGIVAARLFEPVLQQHSDLYFGPFQIAWLHLLGVAGFGLLSALLATVVPAWISSRQDVVAVLAGRRSDQPPSVRSPVLGVILLAAGIAGSAYGAAGSGLDTSAFLIAASAIPAVLGMVLLIPVVLVGLGRLAGPLPLALRYAVRDAVRHRTRTVPAVAAVAATVAGVVALGTGLASDQKEQRETYVAALPHGVGMVIAPSGDPDWSRIESVLRRDIPDATVTAQQGLRDYDGEQYVETDLSAPGHSVLLSSSSDSLGASLLVSDGTWPVGLGTLDRADRDRAAKALAAGTSVVLVDPGTRVDGGQVRVKRQVMDDQGQYTRRATATVPAIFVPVPVRTIPPMAVLSPSAADAVGEGPQTVAVAISGAAITSAEESDAREGVAAITDNASVYVERGFQPDDTAVIVQLVLILLGGVLMLGGTLTATFLALSDAKPDLATLSAVGASPRTRRRVAASYAVVVGVVGALLGIAVGLIPGIAVTYPLTTSYGGVDQATTGPYLAIPWTTVLSLVVGLPLVTALVVGLAARSRLPLVARLD